MEQKKILKGAGKSSETSYTNEPANKVLKFQLKDIRTSKKILEGCPEAKERRSRCLEKNGGRRKTQKTQNTSNQKLFIN